MEIFEEGAEGEAQKNKMALQGKTGWCHHCAVRKSDTVYNIQQQYHPIFTQDIIALVGRQHPGSHYSLKLLIGSMIVTNVWSDFRSGQTLYNVSNVGNCQNLIQLMQVLWEWSAEEAVGRSLTWQSESYHRWGPVRDQVKTVPLIASICPIVRCAFHNRHVHPPIKREADGLQRMW